MELSFCQVPHPLHYQDKWNEVYTTSNPFTLVVFQKSPYLPFVYFASTPIVSNQYVIRFSTPFVRTVNVLGNAQNTDAVVIVPYGFNGDRGVYV